mmetsp:Transcript_135994/g.290699  ORF Transcript_135994/g.290699 Transcript_135994/m.290699 type:complete len:246 (-) Transcript_135994:783-1520(-)
MDHCVLLLVSNAEHGSGGKLLAGKALAAGARAPERGLLHGPILALGVLFVPCGLNHLAVFDHWRQWRRPWQRRACVVVPELHRLAGEALNKLALFPASNLPPITHDMFDIEFLVPYNLRVCTRWICRRRHRYIDACTCFAAIHDAVDELRAQLVLRYQAGLRLIGGRVLLLHFRHAQTEVLHVVAAVCIHDALAEPGHAVGKALAGFDNVAQGLQEVRTRRLWLGHLNRARRRSRLRTLAAEPVG